MYGEAVRVLLVNQWWRCKMKSVQKFQSDRMLAVCNLEREALSYPIPGIIKGRRVERFFIYPKTSCSKRRRPYAWLTLEMEKGNIIQYEHCAIHDFAAELHAEPGFMLSYAVPGNTDFQTAQVMKKKYMTQYEKIRTFVFEKNLSKEQFHNLTEYNKSMEAIWEIELMKFYKALSPEFFDWIERELEQRVD